MELRDYQKEMCARVNAALVDYRSIMVQMPTGTGKTVVLASVVENLIGVNPGATVLVVAHRRELVEQIRDTICRIFDLEDRRKAIHIHSIQWLNRNIDEVEFTPTLVVIDEAHHALAATYSRLWSRWGDAHFLGLTATPYRLSGNGFTDLFDTLICSYSVAEFMMRGILSTFDYIAVRQGSREQHLVDSLLKRGGDGDYQVKEMDSLFNSSYIVERLFESYEHYVSGKRGIVYAVSVRHAEHIARYYCSRGVSAAVISAATPAAERRDIVDKFRHGDASGGVEVLVNVDIFSEGFDCPAVEFIQICRPTLSLSKYIQMVGRGMRPSAGKSCCVIIDNVGLHRRFGLPTKSHDWRSYFNGTALSTEIVKRNRRKIKALHYEYAENYSDMEVIVTHNEIDKRISSGRLCEADKRLGIVEDELAGYYDVKKRLWGLKEGNEIVVEPSYLKVYNAGDGMATVRFCDLTVGVVDRSGAIIGRSDKYRCIDVLGRGVIAVSDCHNGNKLNEWRTIDLITGKSYEGLYTVEEIGWLEVLETRAGQLVLRACNGVDAMFNRRTVRIESHDTYITFAGQEWSDSGATMRPYIHSKYRIARADKFNPLTMP